MKILTLTAGAAQMYCGSCLRDNTLAAELKRQGHQVILLPLYTPTRTDDINVSDPHVFFGGISIYLEQKWPVFRTLPRFRRSDAPPQFLEAWVSPYLVRTHAAHVQLGLEDARVIGLPPETNCALLIAQSVIGHRSLSRVHPLFVAPVLNFAQDLQCLGAATARRVHPATSSFEGNSVRCCLTPAERLPVLAGGDGLRPHAFLDVVPAQFVVGRRHGRIQFDSPFQLRD